MDGGYDRAHLLVQLGKSHDPFSRMWRGGDEEGAGRFGAIAEADALVCNREQPGVASARWSNTGDGTEREQYVFHQMEPPGGMPWRP